MMGLRWEKTRNPKEIKVIPSNMLMGVERYVLMGVFQPLWEGWAVSNMERLYDNEGNRAVFKRYSME